jgi:MFS family permease
MEHERHMPVVCPTRLSRFASIFRDRPSLSNDEITPEQRQRSMRIALASGVFSSIANKGMMGAALVGFARALGATPFWIGLLAAANGISLIGQPLGSYLLSRSSSRKGLFMRTAYIGRFALFALVGAALFLPPGAATVFLIFGVVIMRKFADALGSPSWMSWMTDLPTEHERGWFWSTRNMIVNIASMTAAVGLNWYLGSDPSMTKFAVYFAIVGVAGVLDIFFHRGVNGIRVAAENSRENPVRMFRRPFRDRAYGPVLLFHLLFSFGTGIGVSMLHLMLLEEIHLSYFEIGIFFSGIIGIMNVLASRVWGRLIDNLKEGPRLVLIICATASAIIPLIWPFVGPRDFVLITVNVILVGVFQSGNIISRMAVISAYSPQEHRPTYASMNVLVMAVGSMLGALLAGTLAEIFVGFSASWGPIIFTPLRSLFILSSGVRIMALFVLPFIREPESLPIGVYVRQVFALNPFHHDTWVYVREKVRKNGNGDG